MVARGGMLGGGWPGLVAVVVEELEVGVEAGGSGVERCVDRERRCWRRIVVCGVSEFLAVDSYVSLGFTCEVCAV